LVSVTTDLGGRLWVAAGAEFGMFRNEAFVPAHKDPGKQFELLGSEDGGLWVVEGSSLYKYIAGRLRTVNVPLAVREGGVSIRKIYEDRQGRLWIGTGGLGLFWRQEGSATAKVPLRVSTQQIVLSIGEDREGNIWVGTDGSGLNRLKPQPFDFHNTRTGLSDNNVLSVFEDKEGGLWLSTSAGGLNRVKDGRVQRFTRKEGLDYETLSAVFGDSRGRTWVATWGGGVYYAEPEGKFTQLTTLDGLSSDVVLAIYEDTQGVIWFGTYGGGVNEYRDGQFHPYTTREGLSHDDVRAIHQDRRGHMWFGTGGGGLSRWADGKFTTFRKADGLAGDFVRTIYEDQTGTLWIGTGAGISRLKDGTFFNITTRHGLPDNAVNQILEDGNGQLWMGSGQGISRVRKQELEDRVAGKIREINCVTYSASEGVSRCNGGFQPSGWRSRTGRLFFPMVTGLAVVDPARLKSNTDPPPVVIEETIVDDQLYEPGQEVKVASSAQRVGFRFTGLDLAAPARMRFKYRLEGFDPDWIVAGADRSAFYTRVPPGSYRFRVIAANMDGVWNQEGSSWAITVVPPTWKTWWFRTLVGIVIVGSIISLVRYVSVKRMEGRLALLQQQNALERERARIAQDMHDDLGASLTQIAYLSDLGQRSGQAPPGVADQFRKISATAREVVRAMDEIVWAINPRNDSLDHLVDYLCQYADDYLDSAGIRCWQEAPSQMPARRVSAEVRHNVFLVVKEALNNVVKHSRVSEVWLKIGWDGARLHITLADEGKGFNPDKVGPSGCGLGNMRKRVADCHGTFELHSCPGEGTRIEVNLPI
jgi:signal transduction histidine kinase